MNGGGFTLSYAEGASKPLFRYVREAAVTNLKIYAPYFKGCLLVRNCEIEPGVTMGKDKATGEIGGNVVSFAGRMYGTIINCVSYADLYSTGPASGIVSGKSQSMGMFNIVSCAFRGSITSTGSNVGGIIGMGYMADSAPNTLCVTIQNCYVDGTITGADNVGGILGTEPSCIQNWSPAYIRNNLFYGTVKATKSNRNVGAVVGYMTSLNRNNIFENNHYLDSCGESGAVGGAKYVDTSCKTHETDIAVTYFDTGEAKPNLVGVDKTNLNRTDDPLGKDAAKLAKPVSAAEMADGSITSLLNKGEGSLKNWIQGGAVPGVQHRPGGLCAGSVWNTQGHVLYWRQAGFVWYRFYRQME